MNKSEKVNNSSRVKESLSERPGRSKIRHPSGTYNPGVDIRYLGVRGDGGGEGESSPRASCQNSGFAVEPRLATRTPRFHDHFILVPKKVQPNRFRTLNYVAPLTLSIWPCIF